MSSSRLPAVNGGASTPRDVTDPALKRGASPATPTSSQPMPPPAAMPPPAPAKAAPPSDEIDDEDDHIDNALDARLDSRPPPPGKTSAASATPTASTSTSAAASPSSSSAPSEPQPPAKVRGLLDEEDEEEEPVGEINGPEEPAPKIAPVVVNKEDPLPLPPVIPKTAPPQKTAAATGLTDQERLRLLEDRFLRGEITELTYRELREKLGKK
jgi:hypothetical protein